MCTCPSISKSQSSHLGYTELGKCLSGFCEYEMILRCPNKKTRIFINWNMKLCGTFWFGPTVYTHLLCVSRTNWIRGKQVVKLRTKTLLLRVHLSLCMRVHFCELERDQQDRSGTLSSRKLKPGQPLIHWETFPYVTGCPPLIKLSDLLHILSQSFIFIHTIVVDVDNIVSFGATLYSCGNF